MTVDQTISTNLTRFLLLKEVSWSVAWLEKQITRHERFLDCLDTPAVAADYFNSLDRLIVNCFDKHSRIWKAFTNVAADCSNKYCTKIAETETVLIDIHDYLFFLADAEDLKLVESDD